MFGALRRTSMEVSRDVLTELTQSRASTMGFIEIPVFYGDDLRPWIDWMENRFASEDFTDDQKMVLAYSVIRGEAGSGTTIEYGSLERKWQETERMTPSSSFLVTDSVPEAEATNIDETDSCWVTDCDHDDDDNDHDDSFLAQEALHYEETILETLLIERSEFILKVESKPEDRGRYYTMAIDCFHQQRTTLNHQVHVSNWEPRLQFTSYWMCVRITIMVLGFMTCLKELCCIKSHHMSL
ncbi:hypothetical protein YC2023_098092 [Brassica napus]